MSVLRVLFIAFLLGLSATAVPLTPLPASQISGSIQDSNGTQPAKDAIAVWWRKYGVTKNVLEIHVFTKKLTPQERKVFIEKFSQEAELERAFNNGKGHHPVFDIPRLVVQVPYQKAPENFAKGRYQIVNSTWYAKPGSFSAGNCDAKLTISGLVWDGGEITMNGTGKPQDPSFPGHSWELTGTAPLIFMDL